MKFRARPMITLQFVHFADGSIAYLYDADGNKLRASYAVASYAESMPVTQVMQGSISSQAQQPYMARNNIDYCGSAVYENGKLAYVPIDVGYITFADSTAASAPTFHYYPFSALRLDGINSVAYWDNRF